MTETHILYAGPIVTRATAAAAGETRYFTGKPCKHGHLCQRRVIGAACVECADIRRNRIPGANYARVRAWRALHPEARREEARRYRAKYPEKRAATSKRWRERHIEKVRPIEAEKARNRRKSNPEAQKLRTDKYKERQEQKYAEIAGRPRANQCEICMEKEKTVFDHCHQSGMFRGWICDRCNKTLGMVKDSPRLLKKLAKYLEANHVEIDDKEPESALQQGVLWSGQVLPN